MDKLKKLAETQSALKETSSLNEKKRILTEYAHSSDSAFNTRVFNNIINEDIKFYVTAKKVLEKVDEIESHTLFRDFKVYNLSDEEILQVYDTLSKREVTGNAALELCTNTYSKIESADPAVAKMFLNILDKDFGCGVSSSILNDVFAGSDVVLKRKFGVALANKYFDRADKVDFKTQDWYASRKCEGLRCICIKENGVVRFWSRQEKEFFTLGVLKDIIEKLPYDNFVLDGELCQVDANGDEDFQSIMKLARRKDYTIPNPFYQLFDMLSVDEFFGKTTSKKFSERNAQLLSLFDKNYKMMQNNFIVLSQVKVEDISHFNELYDHANSLNWEGLMIRRDVPYEGKRTNDLLKVKDFLDDEFVVVGYELGDMRMVEDGRQVTRNVLTNVFIDYKGNRVGVGSGFNKKQRIYYAEHPEEIMGRTITVKYFEETTNQNGGVSMRFPTIKCVYGEDGRVM